MRLGGEVFRWDGDPERFALRHEQAGFRAAVCPYDLKAGNTARNRAFAEALAGRDVCMAEVGAWGNPLSRNPEEAAAAKAFLTERLALAEELGAVTCVNIVGTRCWDNWYGPDADNYSRDFFALAVDTAREVLDAVKPRRTALSFEMMPYSFLDSPGRYVELLRAIDRPAVGVHYDPCNTVNSPRRYYRNGEYIREMFRLLGDRILTVHVKDIHLDTAPTTVQLREVPVGEGNLDYAALIRCVRRVNPDLPLILEHLPNEAAYTRSAQAFRDRWNATR